MSINKPCYCRWIDICSSFGLTDVLGFWDSTFFFLGFNEGTRIWMCSNIPHGTSTQLSKCKHLFLWFFLAVFSFLSSLFHFNCFSWLGISFSSFQDVREDLRCSMAKDAVTIKNESLKIGEGLDFTGISSNLDKEELVTQPPKDSSLDFQKKITLVKHENQDSSSSSFLGNRETYKQLLGMHKIWLLFVKCRYLGPIM